MSAELCAAGDVLAAILERENQALRALDLAGAGSLLADKMRAIDAFLTVQKQTQPIAIGSTERQQAEALSARLERLTAENRRLLDRAITVQGRVLGVIARAVPAPDGTGYRPSGRSGGPGHGGPVRPTTLAFSARA